MKDTRNLSCLIVGKVMDRALMEIKDGDHQLFTRIMDRNMPFRLMPIVYKVEPETGCWICMTATASRSSLYPRVRFNGKICKVSRLIFEEFTGIAPGSGQVLHKCDNPECINPEHLYLGTAKDNGRDRKERGKSSHPCSRKPLYKLRKTVSVKDYWEKLAVCEPSATHNRESQVIENIE